MKQPDRREKSERSNTAQVTASKEGRKIRKKFSDITVGIGLVALLAVIFAGILIAVLRVKYIEVENEAIRYTDGEISEASGLSGRAGMLTFSARRAQESIMQKLPYIDAVTIRRHFPQTLEIAVRYTSCAMAVANADGTYLLLSPAGKVLERAAARPADYTPVLKGVAVADAVEGSVVRLENEAALEQITAFVGALRDVGFLNVTGIDFSTPDSLAVTVDYTIELALGPVSNAAEKLPFAKEVVRRFLLETPAPGFVHIDLTEQDKAVTGRSETPTFAPLPAPGETIAPGSTEETASAEADTAAPETAAPETVAPETAAPETAAPETAAPETAAPTSPAAEETGQMLLG